MSKLAYYRLAAGVDVVPLSEDSFLFRSSTLAVKMEGPMAVLLTRRVLPILDRYTSLHELEAQLNDIAPDNLKEGLDSLVSSHVLQRTEILPTHEQHSPFTAFLEQLGADPFDAIKCLQNVRIGIFGLEAQGAHLALELARLGIGACILADPFPLEERDQLLVPPATFRLGLSRQNAVAEAIANLAPSMNVTLAGELTRNSVRTLAESSDLLVGCFDRGYETVHHWINRAAIVTGTPALFSEIRTHIAILGPYILPGQTACYMCYRMRRVACEQNYDEAMAYERFINQRKQPSLSSRATPPFLSAYVSSLLVGEIIKLVALTLQSNLAARVMEFDSLTFESKFHSILKQPECAVCGVEKKNSFRKNLTLIDLSIAAECERSGNLQTLKERLVSSQTGVVCRCEPFVKDPVEPAIPFVVRADIANHRFRSKHDEGNDICSGKGLTLEDARVSALGEAVERYSGAVYLQEEVLYARRSELMVGSVDPCDLVLYHPSQYQDLPYAPYKNNRLGWVSARSLVNGHDVFVPALAVFMNYQTHLEEEFIFPITSNGLAAGRTLLSAVLAASLEVLERDAFMIAWLNCLPARRYSALAHPDPQIVALAQSYLHRGVEIRLYQLPAEHHCSVFAGIALEGRGGDGPAAVVGLGADIDPVVASRKAVLEVCQVRPSLRRRLRRSETQARLRELLDDPRQVTTIDDHDLLYSSRDSLPRLGFWLDAEEELFAWTPTSIAPAQVLSDLVAWLRDNGSDLLYVNLTPPDMAELGLYTARAILPGFQPIDFGWKERRLGGTRIYTLPQKIGLRTQPTHWDDLNQNPHPLA